MRFDRIEKGLRWAGALGALASMIAVYSGVVRAAGHAEGRVSEHTPRLGRKLMHGSAAFYAPMSAAALWLLYLAWRPVLPAASASMRAAATLLGALLYFPGLALMVWGRLTMGDMHNVSSNFGAQLFADHRLVTSGPFALIRHPMYVGGILAELGALLIYRTWATLLIAVNIPALVVRSRHEEALLSEHFGEQWTGYSQRVPGWIPRVGSRPPVTADAQNLVVASGDQQG